MHETIQLLLTELHHQRMKARKLAARAQVKHDPKLDLALADQTLLIYKLEQQLQIVRDI